MISLKRGISLVFGESEGRGRLANHSYLGLSAETPIRARFISFHFHFIKEGSPSTRVVLQGALHLKTLIYNYILKRIITI